MPTVDGPPLETPPTRRLGDGIYCPVSDFSPNASSDVSTSKNSTPSCDSEEDSASTTSEMFRGSCTQSQLDFEFAQQMYDEEKKRAEEEDYNLARAQQLADKWAEEERRKESNKEEHDTRKGLTEALRLADTRARQEQLTRENEVRSVREAARAKRKVAEEIRREEEAAARVRRLAQRTEALAKEAAAAALSRDERRAKYVPDIPQVATKDSKTEKSAKLRREREYAQDFDERNRARRESSKKRYEEAPSPIIPLQRVPRPYQQTYSSQQRATPTRSHRPTPVKIKCVSCMEAGDSARMAVLSCKHAYCGDCLSGK